MQAESNNPIIHHSITASLHHSIPEMNALANIKTITKR